jgi:hypothetical protein
MRQAEAFFVDGFGAKQPRAEAALALARALSEARMAPAKSSGVMNISLGFPPSTAQSYSISVMERC